MKTLLLVLVGAVSLAWVQQPPATPYAPKQSDRPEAVTGDEPGFQPIFDGKTLSGWEGDPTYWRVEDGSLVGEITPATVIKSNTFIIWRGGRPKDFELKLDYRITPEGNSGINYRSAVVPDPVTPGQQVRDARLSVRSRRPEAISRQQLRGEGPAVSGRARTGRRASSADDRRCSSSTIGDPDELAKAVTDDWNAVHLIVRGNTLTHIDQRPSHDGRHRRRCAESSGGRADRRPGARRSADEGRVSQPAAEELVAPWPATRSSGGAPAMRPAPCSRRHRHRPSVPAITSAAFSGCCCGYRRPRRPSSGHRTPS